MSRPEILFAAECDWHTAGMLEGWSARGKAGGMRLGNVEMSRLSRFSHDALNRLASAQTASNPNVTQWGQSYNYDGFGNLTAENVIKGSAPTLNAAYNAATNRQTGDTADANGNLGTGTSGNVYDIFNRLVTPAGTTVQYAYNASNQRVWRGNTTNAYGVIDFFGPNGKRLATYTLNDTFLFTVATTDVYFGSRLIGKGTYNSSCPHADCVNLASVATDRLGSIGKFYPFGLERPSATQNDTEKFTGYYRDASSGLDYAVNRYEQPGVGRFMTPDPYQASGGPADPGSWNRYAYTRGDPVNRKDPAGLMDRWGDSGNDTTYLPGDDGDDNFPDIPLGGGMLSISVYIGQIWAELRASGCPNLSYSAFASNPWTYSCPPTQNVANAPKSYYLAVTGDCYKVPTNGGKVERDITYQLMVQQGGQQDAPSNAGVIWEHLTGDIPFGGPDQPSSSAPGTFPDVQQVGLFVSLQHLTQTFSVVLGDGTTYSLGAPAFGGNPVLNIVKTDNYVSINENIGGQLDSSGHLIPGTYTPCPN